MRRKARGPRFQSACSDGESEGDPAVDNAILQAEPQSPDSSYRPGSI
jgi:hypothetical protein